MFVCSAKVSDGVILLGEGKVQAQGAPQDVLQADDQVQYKFFFPFNKRITQQRHQIIGNHKMVSCKLVGP